MERRIPSLSITDYTSSNLRRRSGTYPSRESEEQQEELEATTQHTVLLVERPLPSQPSCILPFAAVAEEHSMYRNKWNEEQEYLLSQVPLTPRPDPPRRIESDSSVQTTDTRISQIPRLPTPDFGHSLDGPTEARARSGPTASRSYLPRGLSFVSFHLRPTVLFSSTPASSRPQSVRTQSYESDSSEWSTGASDSVDSGHDALIPAIGTTTKFTHKWPRPQSLRYPESRRDNPYKPLGSYKGQSVAMVLEDGQGYEMNAVQRWSLFKWSLFFSVLTVFAYGAAGLVCAVMTWFRTWEQADVLYVADNDILILITLAASIMTFTALVGISGVFLNSRPILAAYAILLWPALASLLTVGYISYKRAAFSLDHKLNLSWSQYYTPIGRLLIQDSLRCCGFYNALHEATPSKRCYPRTPLPGCKGKLYRFESENLEIIWSAAFALVPLHLLNIMIALLCANHLTRTFGMGMTPKQYRLSSKDVKADADKILQGMKQAGLRTRARPNVLRESSSEILRQHEKEGSSLSEHHAEHE